ncbi:DUF192 domain-containing protein [Candidatus Woesearchaeota archaeon]|nr:DUF192 domain-containing protein [Candidatus Woesearchaeota archaeon]
MTPPASAFPGRFGVARSTVVTMRQGSPRSAATWGAMLFLLFLVSCAPQPKVTFYNGEGYLNVPVMVADDAAERSQGLMGTYLRDGDGMLFVFKDAQSRTFWMKNMLIPLDIIFLDESMTVVEIKANIPPCDKDPCPTYPTNKPAKYVVEVEAGFAKEHNLFPGVRMTTNVDVTSAT